MFQKTWKTSFWAFKITILPKKSFKSVLILYTTAIQCKKSERLHALIFNNTWKTWLWAHSRSILKRKPQNKIFSRKTYFRSILSLWAYVTLRKIFRPKILGPFWSFVLRKTKTQLNTSDFSYNLKNLKEIPKVVLQPFGSYLHPAFTCSKSTIKTIE